LENWRRALLPRTLRDGKGGSVDGAPHSLKRLHGGGLGGGAPSLGTLDDMLRKSPDTGISVGGPFQSRGTCCTGGGLIYRDL